jgi:SAM-dependent methyltransferase
VRQISETEIKAHADRRFRSEYDYALFEYYRSAKVIAFLERAGVEIRGPRARCRVRRRRHAALPRRACGRSRGHRPDRSIQSSRLATRPRAGLARLHFLQADGMALPFAAGAFDLVLSHAVIEHVSDAALYLRECRRV